MPEVLPGGARCDGTLLIGAGVAASAVADDGDD